MNTRMVLCDLLWASGRPKKIWIMLWKFFLELLKNFGRFLRYGWKLVRQLLVIPKRLQDRGRKSKWEVKIINKGFCLKFRAEGDEILATKPLPSTQLVIK